MLCNNGANTYMQTVRACVASIPHVLRCPCLEKGYGILSDHMAWLAGYRVMACQQSHTKIVWLCLSVALRPPK